MDIRMATNIIGWDQKFKSILFDSWNRDTFVKTHFAKAHHVDSMKLTIISRCLLCLIKIRRRIKKFLEINILWTIKYLLVFINCLSFFIKVWIFWTFSILNYILGHHWKALIIKYYWYVHWFNPLVEQIKFWDFWSIIR